MDLFIWRQGDWEGQAKCGVTLLKLIKIIKIEITRVYHVLTTHQHLPCVITFHLPVSSHIWQRRNCGIDRLVSLLKFLSAWEVELGTEPGLFGPSVDLHSLSALSTKGAWCLIRRGASTLAFPLCHFLSSVTRVQNRPPRASVMSSVQQGPRSKANPGPV